MNNDNWNHTPRITPLADAPTPICDQHKTPFSCTPSVRWFVPLEIAQKLERENAVLAARIVELKRDKEIVDWFEAHINAGVGASGHFCRIIGLSRTLEDFRDREWRGATVREAYAAMREDESRPTRKE